MPKKVTEKSKGFYHSKAWRRVRRVVLARDRYRCKPCWRRNQLTVANTVHHIKPLDEYPELALTLSNLESICPSCHNREHPEKGKPKSKTPRNINVIEEQPNPEII
jgi:5-methylcytosine-specific restriction endonuclease McrA